MKAGNIETITVINIEQIDIKSIEKNEINSIGYICNIDKYLIYTKSGYKISMIIKYVNNNNPLSATAKEMNLYENENMFYQKISKLNNIGLKVPYSYYTDSSMLVLDDINIHNDGCFGKDLDITNVYKIIDDISRFHNKYTFSTDNSYVSFIPKVKDITEFRNIVHNKYNKFINVVQKFVSISDINKLQTIYEQFDTSLDSLSQFPLSICHGDFKTSNMFFSQSGEITYIDWQYLQLNKGISDITFLLVESKEYDNIFTESVLLYYYNKIYKNMNYRNYQEMIEDFKKCLGVFPFVVIIWFFTIDNSLLVDKSFHLRFFMNFMSYIKYM